MPTYDYVCDNCGHSFEKFQSMSADLLNDCPSCGEAQLKRLIGTGAGIIFKGSGFYQTDYRSESYQTGKKTESKTKDTGDKAKKTDKAETTPKKTETKAKNTSTSEK